jgi:hypothetical protein
MANARRAEMLATATSRLAIGRPVVHGGPGAAPSRAF